MVIPCQSHGQPATRSRRHRIRSSPNDKWASSGHPPRGGRPGCRKAILTTTVGCPRCLAFGHLGDHPTQRTEAIGGRPTPPPLAKMGALGPAGSQALIQKREKHAKNTQFRLIFCLCPTAFVRAEADKSPQPSPHSPSFLRRQLQTACPSCPVPTSTPRKVPLEKDFSRARPFIPYSLTTDPCSLFPRSLVPLFPRSLVPSFPRSLVPSFPRSLLPVP